jgi:hypothetical protein
VVPIPLLGAGMERNVSRRRFGVLSQLAHAGVGIFPVNFILAGVDRVDDTVGVFVRQRGPRVKGPTAVVETFGEAKETF